MDITALHIEFEKLQWGGIATFAYVIKQMGCGGASMAFIRRTYAVHLETLESDNHLYTVEHYLSDLLSRRQRLSKEQVEWTNKTFYQLAHYMEGSRNNRGW